MDDAVSVRGDERARHLRGDIERLSEFERSAPQSLAQRFTRNQFGGEEVPALAGLLDVIDRHDVGMIQRGGGAGLLDEARHTPVIRSNIGGEELERDFTPELRVDRAIDFSHPTGAQQ
jgi:hypothetical protein